MSIGELAAVLRRRAFGFVLLLVALVNCMPLPPGVSSLAGVPVFLFGLQMLLGRPRPWLPRPIRRRTFQREVVLQTLQTIRPYLDRLQRIARPRLAGVFWMLSPRPVGALVVVLSLFIMIPMMFTNIPPALATVFLALALIEEDGLMLLIGFVLAVVAMAVSLTLAAGMITVIVMTAARFLGL